MVLFSSFVLSSQDLRILVDDSQFPTPTLEDYRRGYIELSNAAQIEITSSHDWTLLAGIELTTSPRYKDPRDFSIRSSFYGGTFQPLSISGTPIASGAAGTHIVHCDYRYNISLENDPVGLYSGAIQYELQEHV